MSNNNEVIYEFISSEYYLFIDGDIKIYGEELLIILLDNFNSRQPVISIEKALAKVARLKIPLDIKKSIPDFFIAFLEYAQNLGKLTDIENMINYIASTKTAFLAQFRDDGSIRQKSYVKKYTPVGRNDPCPCGSGKKFKKCCMKLIS